jgi:hypothetical protein
MLMCLTKQTHHRNVHLNVLENWPILNTVLKEHSNCIQSPIQKLDRNYWELNACLQVSRMCREGIPPRKGELDNLANQATEEPCCTKLRNRVECR